MSALDILKERKSIRSFSNEPVPEKVRNRLNSEATYINSHESGLNFRTCFDDSAPFDGFARSYGMFKNARNYLAVVVDPTFPHTLERAGYYSEQWIIEALKSGIATCYVGGTFSQKHVDTRIEVYEKVPFVIAFGYAAGRDSLIARMSMKIAHRRHYEPRHFYAGDDAEYNEARARIPWLDTALEAVACAPSALNSRPVRLKMKEHEGIYTVEAFTVQPEKYAIELGIAKFNVAYAVGGDWEWGEHGIINQCN